MNKLLYIFLLGVLILNSCKKEEESTTYAYRYKLKGLYARDTALKNDGYKSIDFKDAGNYCWTRVIDGLDSNFCYGKYEQTSDTSMLWEGSTLITFTITPLDTIPNGMILKMNSSPAVPPLFGYFENH